MNTLDHLRAEMEARGITVYLVPHGDEFQNEYLPADKERLAFLTGFGGSAGMAIITLQAAFVFVDGRYTLQVYEEVDQNLFTPIPTATKTPQKWLAENLKKSDVLGLDAKVHSIQGFKNYQQLPQKMVLVEENLVDLVWPHKPPAASSKAQVHPMQYAGQSVADKVDQITHAVKKKGLDAFVLTQADSICWLLNIRGAEIPYNPLVLSYAIAYADGKVDWFVDPVKTTPKLLKTLPDTVTVHLERDFPAGLKSLTDQKVGLDFAGTTAWLWLLLKEAGATVVNATDPCALPKACKNKIEIHGARAAHVRDGVAVTRFLSWLSQEAPKGQLTERAVADKLLEFRQTGDLFRGLSFETISGVGPNGAVVHYRVDTGSNRPLNKGDVYLVDSGGQYLDGTTDITRTIFIGDNPPAEVKENFTRVLKGHIAIDMARFPEGTAGDQLDALARHALWEVGLDYAHSTGHGVGSYLCVHEGPQRIATRQGGVPLEVGMILSNEPGYYKEGAYGIRLENLILVTKARPKGWLAFETLTLAPFDLILVDKDLLTPAALKWITDYHRTVQKQLGPHLDEQERAWLESQLKVFKG